VVVEYSTDPELTVGTPRTMIEGSFAGGNGWDFDVAPDGRFLMLRSRDQTVPRRIELVTGWFAELERLVPTSE